MYPKLQDLTRRQAIKRLASIQARLERRQQPTAADEHFMYLVLDEVGKIFVAEIRERQARVPGLKTDWFGHVAVWGGELTPGCRGCVERGLATIRSSSKCNLDCNFCYYGDTKKTIRPLGDDHFEVAERPVTSRELKLMLHKAAVGPGQFESVAWVFLEPFITLDKHLELVAFVAELGLHQHMYTNGTLCTRDNLEPLADAGLPEIRFNLAASDCSEEVIRAMHDARELFEWLCVESPMHPAYFDAFVEKRREILATGVTHIHCAELHLNANNFERFQDEELYQYSMGYVSPMSSRRLTYDLMDLAAREGWEGVVLHDCSNEVKFLRGVASERFGILGYESELPGMPLGWFRDALTRYPLTRDAV